MILSTNRKLLVIKAITRVATITSPEHMLWLACVAQIVKDLDKDDLSKNSRWIFNPVYRDHLDNLCSIIDLDPAYFKKLCQISGLLEGEGKKAA